MKTLTRALLLSMAVLSAGAYASDNVEPNNVPFQGVYGHVDTDAPTRAQIAAELAQAKKNGTYTFGENDYPPTQISPASGKSHEHVRAELAQAKANGQYSFGELDYPPRAN